jgi:hypothetical protein
MLTHFAHLGHDHTADTLTIDHCMPIIIGAVLIIAALVGVIIYLLTAWQPKKRSTNKQKRSK